MNFWQQLLLIIVVATGGYLLYYVTRTKANLEKINKNIILGILLGSTLLPFLFQKFYMKYGQIQYIQLFFSYYLMFLFIHLYKRDKIRKNRPVVGKPMAKPSRAKK